MTDWCARQATSPGGRGFFSDTRGAERWKPNVRPGTGFAPSYPRRFDVRDAPTANRICSDECEMTKLDATSLQTGAISTFATSEARDG